MNLNILLRDDKVEGWIEREGFKTSSILTILKKNLGYKNQDEVIRKTLLVPSFLKIKLCWKEDTDYSKITQILNGIIRYYTSVRPGYRYGGRVLLDFIENMGKLEYVPYYKTLEDEETRTLKYWTIEKTIERWIREKF